MAITIKDVAVLAGVSASTVSRVISDNPRISDETKKNVRCAMKELNYHPNVIARSLANKKTKTIGLILPSIDEDLVINPFFAKVMRGISLYAEKEGYYIIYTYSDNEQDELMHIEKLINGRLVDGIILAMVRKNDACIKYLKSIKHPFVVIGKPENTEEVCFVDNDNFHATYEVVNYLLKKGKRQIAFIGGSKELNVTIDRMEGYKKALQNCGVSINNCMIEEADFTEHSGYEAMNKILQIQIPSAIVTTDDILAIGVIKAIEERQLKDIDVVGFNNTLIAKYHRPSITSVEINGEKLGYYAVKLLINQLNDIDVEIKNYIVETELVERESTEIVK